MTAAARAAVVIPAHNEERSIPRLLEALTEPVRTGELDVIVVCNGCSDDTAGAAAAVHPAITVLESAEASKYAAMRQGEQAAADDLPLVFVDADVVIGASDVRSLVSALSSEIHVSSPERALAGDRVSWVVRWYYDVWLRLPQVQAGVFGRGVIALSPTGRRRVADLPQVLSDDLVISEAFASSERQVVRTASVLIRPPRTVRDLLRRRIRVVTGNAQADSLGHRSAPARTSLGTLVGLARERPASAPKVAVFAAVTLIARLAARRAIRDGDFTTWRRDDSSRT